MPPTVLVPTILLDAADHLLLYYIVSWHSPHIEGHAGYTTAFILPMSVLLLLGCPHETPLSFTEGVGNGVTSLWHTVRLVLLSSSISSPFIYFRTPPHVPSSSNSIFTLLPLCSSAYLKPWLVHRNYLPKFLHSDTFSLFSYSLDDISLSPSMYLTPPFPLVRNY